MIEIIIEFSYQEQHKVRGNLTTTLKEFSFKNNDELNGFYKGLEALVGKVYCDCDYEVKSIKDNSAQ